MYLSRLQLNSHSRQMWRSVIDRPYKLHQLVMRGFPDGVTREGAHVLHRLEIEADNAILLVQSDIEPDWGSITPDFLLPASPFDPIPNPAIREMNGLDLPHGRTLQFRLTANPTISKVRRDENGERLNSNRVPLVHEEHQIAWLNCKSRKHGFRVLNFNISHAQKQTSRKKGITIFTVQFNGRLQITDHIKFKQALQKGIGPAKAFGCGLLSLAPA